MRLHFPKVAVLGVALLFGSGMRATAAFDAFLEIEGVPGESADATHEGWIQIHSFQTAMLGASSTEVATLPPIRLGKKVDKASPLLAGACATGQHIARAKLNLVRTTPTRARLYQITFEDVLVTGLSAAGVAAEASSSPDELLELLPRRISWTYTEFDLAGKAAQDLVTLWDVATGEAEGNTIPALRVFGATNTDGNLVVTFDAKPATGYRLLGSSTVDGGYAEVSRVLPANGGATSISVPTGGAVGFVIVEELP
jgi:type VI secretion system secreted protein Hcp